MESFEIKQVLKASPSELYTSWLDSVKHSAMTGGDATCSDQVGGEFSVWDGYITGQNISLVKDSQIVQSWRTSEFSDDDKDSRVTIDFLVKGALAEVVLSHEEIPAGQTQYLQGWKDHYFTPMKAYFDQLNLED